MTTTSHPSAVATKVVGTLGPASLDPAVLRRLIDTGLDVVRVNCSHDKIEAHLERIKLIRRVADEAGRQVAVLADLQGPKIRVGDLPEPRTLDTGSRVVLRAGARTCTDTAIPVVYPQFAADLTVGDRVLLHDGLLETVVVDVTGGDVTVEVVRGGLLGSRKGINMPGAAVSAQTPTAQDLEHLTQLVTVGVDYVAMSFVSTAADVVRLRTALDELGSEARIVAKIERPEAVVNLDSILEVVDAVMVARGDLGVEIGVEQVPVVQKRIIAAANARGIPVITATEMLESMIASSRPTRAEASDIANAVFDGTDAVMLSAEMAAGAHPVEAVAYMKTICAAAEDAPELHHPLPRAADGTPGVAVTRAVANLVTDAHAKAVVCFTETGRTARLVATSRPGVPVLALATSRQAQRRCALYRGVTAEIVPASLDTSALMLLANEQVLRHGLAAPDDVIVVVAGSPGRAGGTNRVYVQQVHADVLTMLESGL